jgi:hypothetical protein
MSWFAELHVDERTGHARVGANVVRDHLERDVRLADSVQVQQVAKLGVHDLGATDLAANATVVVSRSGGRWAGKERARSVQWGGFCSSFVRWPLVSVLEVAAVPAAAGCARRVLGGWGVPGELIADAEVIISELMTNATQGGG